MVCEVLDPIDDADEFFDEMMEALQPELERDRQRKISFFEQPKAKPSPVGFMILNSLTEPDRRSSIALVGGGEFDSLASSNGEPPVLASGGVPAFSPLGDSFSLGYAFGVPVWGLQSRTITSVRDMYPEALYDGPLSPVQLITGVLMCAPQLDDSIGCDYVVADPYGTESPILMHDFLAALEEDYCQ